MVRTVDMADVRSGKPVGRGHARWERGERGQLCVWIEKGYPNREACISISVGGEKGVGSGPREQEAEREGFTPSAKSWPPARGVPLLQNLELLARGGPSRSRGPPLPKPAF
jgi:hypothetical protein